MSTSDKPGSSIVELARGAPPFKPVRTNYELVEMYAVEVVDAVTEEMAAAHKTDDPWMIAEEYARYRIEAERARLYSAVMGMLSADLLLLNERELQLFGTLAASLEQPR